MRLNFNYQDTVRAIFFYLDRSHLLQLHSPSLYDTAVALFRKHVFRDLATESKVIDGACELLLADRHGDSEESTLFGSAVKMFHDLQVYTSDFEPRMLAVSQAYVAKWSDDQCASKELPDYVDVAGELLKTEMDRCTAFDLDTTTRRSLLALLENHLIERKESELCKLSQRLSRCVITDFL